MNAKLFNKGQWYVTGASRKLDLGGVIVGYIGLSVSADVTYGRDLTGILAEPTRSFDGCHDQARLIQKSRDTTGYFTIPRSPAPSDYINSRGRHLSSASQATIVEHNRTFSKLTTHRVPAYTIDTRST